MQRSELGRFNVTKALADLGKFKTPILRNIVLTAPYMHDGSIKTLTEVIEHYDKGGDKNRFIDAKIFPLHLTPQEKADLLAFMQAKSPESLAQDFLAYSLPGSDPGAHQSPINIFTNRTKEEHEQHQFVVHFQDEITAVENLGHTIQLDFKQGSTINVGGITYNFKQMHFHTPSEHLIDGITFPMELHIVSATEDPASPHYLVIAILFKMGEESKFINEFLNTIPGYEHSKTDTKVGSIRFTDLLSLSPTGDLGHHYHYKGSLTTPPYTESVNWFVLKKIFEASPEQIKAINKLEGDNARHIKDKNNRLGEDN